MLLLLTLQHSLFLGLLRVVSVSQPVIISADTQTIQIEQYEQYINTDCKSLVSLERRLTHPHAINQSEESEDMYIQKTTKLVDYRSWLQYEGGGKKKFGC